MTEKKLKDAGFIKNDDPQFIYQYLLVVDKEQEFINNEPPVLLYDVLSERFTLYTGNCFVYTNHHNAIDAISWAKEISHFEEN